MRASLILAVAVGFHTYVDCAAQETSSGLRPEVGLEATYWIVDGGSYSTTSQTRWGPTVRFGLRPRMGSRVSGVVALTYANQGSFEPGVAGGALEFVVRVARLGETRRRLNGFLTASIGMLHFDADHQERALETCSPSQGCMFEGTAFRSGWRPVLAGGFGFDLPVTATFVLQPQAQLVRPIGSGSAGPEGDAAMLRFGLGLAWR